MSPVEHLMWKNKLGSLEFPLELYISKYVLIVDCGIFEHLKQKLKKHKQLQGKDLQRLCLPTCSVFHSSVLLSHAYQSEEGKPVVGMLYFSMERRWIKKTTTTTTTTVIEPSLAKHQHYVR